MSATVKSRVVSAALSLSLVATAVFALGAPPADAATISGTWSAKVGAGGVNGTATAQLFTNGAGSLSLKLRKLPVGHSLAVAVYRGTCARAGIVATQLSPVKVTATGTATRAGALSASQWRAISAAAAAGPMTIRIGSGKTAKCGPLVAQPVAPYVAATVSVGHAPSGVAIGPSGVWVTNWADNTLSRIDATTNRVLQTVPVATGNQLGPEAAVFGLGSLWVTTVGWSSDDQPLAGQLLRLDPVSGATQATISVGRGPVDVAVGEGAAWVPAYGDDSVSRVDPATNAVVATIPVCSSPVGVVTAFGSIWASCLDGEVARIDPATNAVTATIPTRDTGGAIAASSGAIWVANVGHDGAADGSVSRIDPSTNGVAATVALGMVPHQLAYGGGSIWVGMGRDPFVARIDVATNAVRARIRVPAPVYAIDANDRTVWAALDLASLGDTFAAAPGKITRINYAGVTSGPFQTASPSGPAAPPSPTPSPSQSPAPSPSPTPTPSAGSTLYVGTYFMFAVPAGWQHAAGEGGPDSVTFTGPNGVLLADTASSPLSLDATVAGAVASIESETGADIEANEPITLGGSPARLLTFHISASGQSIDTLEAVCVRNGRVYALAFANRAGTESADRTLFMNVLSSFAFMSAAG